VKRNTKSKISARSAAVAVLFSCAIVDFTSALNLPGELQAEMDRMAQHTKQPEVLCELFEALGNDRFVIAECLARPALAESLVTTLYAHDQRFHGELRQRAEAELQAHLLGSALIQRKEEYGETAK
jgi:hypothetical protein